MGRRSQFKCRYHTKVGWRHVDKPKKGHLRISCGVGSAPECVATRSGFLQLIVPKRINMKLRYCSWWFPACHSPLRESGGSIYGVLMNACQSFLHCLMDELTISLAAIFPLNTYIIFNTVFSLVCGTVTCQKTMFFFLSLLCMCIFF